MAPNESHLFVSSLCNVTLLPLSSRDGVVFVHFLNLCWSCDLLSPIECCRSDILRLLRPGLKEPCSCHCHPYLMHLLLCKRPGLIMGGREAMQRRVMAHWLRDPGNCQRCEWSHLDQLATSQHGNWPQTEVGAQMTPHGTETSHSYWALPTCQPTELRGRSVTIPMHST